MRVLLALLPAVACLLCAAGPWPLTAPSSGGGDGTLCRQSTAQAERERGIPDQLLTAISRVETGQPDPATGRREAWPWSINVEGTGHVYPSKDAAIAAVRQYQSGGARSIDIGCMQVNLLQHPDAFPSLDAAFDPGTNARYGAAFLSQLFGQTGSWPHAVAAYHSQTPGLGETYQWQVLQAWAEGDGPSIRAGQHRTVTASAALRTPGASGGTLAAGANADVATATAGPFSAAMPVSIQHYGPPVSRLPPGKNRDLSAYRTMPIAMNTVRFTPGHL